METTLATSHTNLAHTSTSAAPVAFAELPGSQQDFGSFRPLRFHAVADAVEGFAASTVRSAAGPRPSAGPWRGGAPDRVLRAWSAPYLAILTGLGLLTFARITRAGASMREDLAGVV